MNRLLIIGAGELGQQIAHLAISDNQFDVIGFADDFASKNSLVMGLLVLCSIEEVESLFLMGKFDYVLLGVGYKHFDFRENLYNKFVEVVPFGKLIHSSAYVDSSAEISEGVIIYPRCIVDKKVVIRENVLVNIGTGIAHDSVVSPHSFIAPMVAIAGNVRIGKQTFVGCGSVFVDGIECCGNIYFGAGSVVVKNIDKQGVYFGNPAKYIKPISK